MARPRCAQCATIAVANQGDVCSDCKSKTKKSTDKLIKDLKKKPPKDPKKK